MSSMRMPMRPGTLIDGSIVKTMLSSSGRSSSSEMYGRSCRSRPRQWPARWMNASPSPASSITLRQIRSTSPARAPGTHAAIAASCAGSSTSSYVATNSSDGSPQKIVRPKSEQ